MLPCWLEMVECSGVTLLDNTTVQFGDIALGGLSSVSRRETPDRRVLAELSTMPGFPAAAVPSSGILCSPCGGLRH